MKRSTVIKITLMGKTHVSSKRDMIIFVLSVLRIFFCCAIALGMIHDILESSAWLKKGLKRLSSEKKVMRYGHILRQARVHAHEIRCSTRVTSQDGHVSDPPDGWSNTFQINVEYQRRCSRPILTLPWIYRRNVLQ